jgi:hypothetical protein
MIVKAVIIVASMRTIRSMVSGHLAGMMEGNIWDNGLMESSMESANT